MPRTMFKTFICSYCGSKTRSTTARLRFDFSVCKESALTGWHKWVRAD